MDIELSEFIKSTLLEIQKGIAEAKDEACNHAIAPSERTYDLNRNTTILNETLDKVYEVRFSLNTTVGVKDNKSGEGKGKILVVSGQIGASQENTETHTQNISFAVPFIPALIIKQNEEALPKKRSSEIKTMKSQFRRELDHF